MPINPKPLTFKAWRFRLTARRRNKWAKMFAPYPVPPRSVAESRYDKLGYENYRAAWYQLRRRVILRRVSRYCRLVLTGALRVFKRE